MCFWPNNACFVSMSIAVNCLMYRHGPITDVGCATNSKKTNPGTATDKKKADYHETIGL